MPAGSDGAVHGSEQPEGCPDRGENDAEDPQDGDVQQRSKNQQDDAKDDHRTTPYLLVVGTSVGAPDTLCPCRGVSNRASVAPSTGSFRGLAPPSAVRLASSRPGDAAYAR